MLKKRYKLIALLCIICINISVISFAAAVDIPVWNENGLTEETNAEVKEKETEETETKTNQANKPVLELQSKSGILIEASTGQVLYSNNCDEQLRPASVTKVMTLLLIMEALDEGRINLTDKVPCSDTARKMGGSQIWLDENEELTVHEMLKAICVVSANDCCVAMSEFIAGSEGSFVTMMNERAKELGMTNTSFKNCHGIDEEGHLTTAKDISLMSRELIKHTKIFEYTTIWMDSLRDGKSELVNTNKLIRNYKGATGLKTGSTSLALYNVSATATRDDLTLIAVVMCGETSDIRFKDATKLLDYGFANYSAKKVSTKGEVVKEILVNKGVKEKVNVIYKEDLSIIVKKGEDKDISSQVTLSEYIAAPATLDSVVGKVEYSIAGNKVGTVDLVVSEDVPKMNIANMVGEVFNSWFCVLR